MISCNLGKLDEVLEDLKHLSGVKEFQGTSGSYDIIAKVESQKSSQKVITQQIRALSGVRSSLALQCKSDNQY